VNEAPVRIVLSFKDQRSANSARRQLGELGQGFEVSLKVEMISVEPINYVIQVNVIQAKISFCNKFIIVCMFYLPGYLKTSRVTLPDKFCL